MDTSFVYIRNYTCSIPSLDLSQSSCINSAAQKSLIGLDQAQAYCDISDVVYQKTTTNASIFSFGTHENPGFVALDIIVPNYPRNFLYFAVTLTDTNLHFLVSLDNIEMYIIAFDEEKCINSSRCQEWAVLLIHKMGYRYNEWFRKSSLRRLSF